MRRRTLMTVLASAAAHPLLAGAHQKAMPAIGFLGSTAPGPYATFVAAFLQGLQDAGYVERRRDGRCNVYRIHPELAIGDPVVEQQSLRELLRLIGTGEATKAHRPLASSGRCALDPVSPLKGRRQTPPDELKA